MTDQTRPDVSLTANEAAALDDADQQRQRAEAAEAERDQLRYERRLLGAARMVLDRVAASGLVAPSLMAGIRDEAAAMAQRIVDEIGHPVTDEPAIGPNPRAELARLHEQLADAHAAGARSATEVTKWKTRLIDETDRLRDRLDRANTERQNLAQELADVTRDHGQLRKDWRTIRREVDDVTRDRDQLILDLGNMRGIAQGNARHVAMLTGIVERVTAIVDRLHREGLATVHTEELCQALNDPAESPVPSRRAQDAGAPRRHAVAFNALTRALRIADRFVALSEREAVTTAVLNALDADAPQSGQGSDPSSPQWAVIRTAIAWRLWYGDKYDPTFSSACNDLAAAVDELPHIGERELARLFHDTYEQLAPSYGYRTREASAKPWEEVPEQNRALMTATCARVLLTLFGPATGGPVKPRVDLPTYGDNAPGTLRSRP